MWMEHKFGVTKLQAIIKDSTFWSDPRGFIGHWIPIINFAKFVLLLVPDTNFLRDKSLIRLKRANESGLAQAPSYVWHANSHTIHLSADSMKSRWSLNSSKTLFRTGFAGTAMLRPLPFYGPIIENLLEIQIFWYIVLWSLFISYISTTIGSPGCQKRSQFLQRHFHYEYPVKKVVTAHLFWLVDWHLIF